MIAGRLRVTERAQRDGSAEGPGGPVATADGAPGGRFGRWLLGWADHPAGAAVLVTMALLEATVFPAPTEGVLIALVLARRERAGWLAALATGASVAGGLLGFYVSGALFTEVARPLLRSAGLVEQLATMARLYREHAFVALVTSGYTPIPYMLYTMTAGAFDVPVGTFVIGSLIGRGLKYGPMAALAYVLGPAVRRVVGRYAGWIAVALTLAAALLLLLRRG